MNVETLLEGIHEDLSQSDIDLIRRAYDLAAVAHADQERASGEPYISAETRVPRGTWWCVAKMGVSVYNFFQEQNRYWFSPTSGAALCRSHLH